MAGEQDNATQTQRLLQSFKPQYNRIRDKAEMPSWGSELESSGLNRDRVLWLVTEQNAAAHGRYYTPERLDDLELYALLAQVDWKLWTQVTLEIWPELTKKASVPLDEIRPVTVGIDVKMRQYADLEVVEPRSWSSGSQDYRNLRDLLASMLPETSGSSVQVPVRVSIPYEWNRLTKIVEYATAQQGQVPQDRRGRRPARRMRRTPVRVPAPGRYKGLRIQSMKLELWRVVLGRPPVRVLMDALARGLHIVDFGLIQWEVIHDDPKLYVQAVQTLFALDCADNERRRGVEEFVHRDRMRPAMVPSVFSAVYASESVASVGVSFGDTTMPIRMRALVLSWVTYALFRREGKPIQKLTLGVNDLRHEDIDTMDTILNASDPLVELLDRPDSCQGLTISAQKFSLLSDRSRPSSCPWGL